MVKSFNSEYWTDIKPAGAPDLLNEPELYIYIYEIWYIYHISYTVIISHVIYNSTQTHISVPPHRPATTPSPLQAAPPHSCSELGTALQWRCVGVHGGCTWDRDNSLSATPRQSLRQGFETRHGDSPVTTRMTSSGVDTAETEHYICVHYIIFICLHKLLHVSKTYNFKLLSGEFHQGKPRDFSYALEVDSVSSCDSCLIWCKEYSWLLNCYMDYILKRFGLRHPLVAKRLGCKLHRP